MTDSATTTTTTTTVYAWTADDCIYTGSLQRWADHAVHASYSGARVSHPYAFDTAEDAGIRTRRVTPAATDAIEGDDYRVVVYNDPLNGASAIACYAIEVEGVA